MAKDRFILVSQREIEEAVKSKDKDRLDSLAFAIVCKGEFQNSIVYKRNHRDFRAYFHLGNDKVKKVISAGIKYGYMAYNAQEQLVVSKLRDPDERCIKISLCGYRRKNRDNGSVLRIKDIKKQLRERIAVNTISVKEQVENIKSPLRLRHLSKMTRQQEKDYLRACKLCRREKTMNLYGDLMEMTSLENLDNPKYSNGGISYKTFATKLGVSKSTARKIVKEIAKRGEITIEQVLIPYCEVKGKWDMYETNELIGEGEIGGYLKRGKNSDTIFLQRSNIYKISQEYRMNEVRRLLHCSQK